MNNWRGSVGLAMFGMLLLAFAVSMPVGAGGKVVFTFSIADLGQGVWGGGSLYADGSAKGVVAFSAGNGEFIWYLVADSWTVWAPGLLDVCFDLVVVKGPPPFPSPFCTGPALGGALITGEPVMLDFDGDGKADQIFRLMPVN